MVFFPQLLSITAPSSLTAATFASLTTTLVAETAREFFISLFSHPELHWTAVAILAGATVAAGAGLAFLMKKIYEKYCPEQI